MANQNDVENISVEVKNVGGIETYSANFHPGMNILSGRNATNRTSLLKAVMAISGSDTPALRAGTEEGWVKATIDGQEYKRTVRKTDSGYEWVGDQYCEDPTVVELYGFLLEQNEVRQGVISGVDLREIIMRPIDTSEIDNEITRLKAQKEDIKHKQKSIKEKKNRISELEQLIDDRTEELESVKEEKRAVDTELESKDVDEQIVKEDNSESESTRLTQELNAVNKEINQIETQIEANKKRVENRKDELSTLTERDDEDIDSLRSEKRSAVNQISRLENRKSDLENKRQIIKPLRTFISHITSGSTSADDIANVLSEFSEGFNNTGSDGDVLSGLIAPDTEDETVCLLCGNEIETDHYSQINTLSMSAFQEINSQLKKIDDELSDVVSKRESLEIEIGDVMDTKNRVQKLESEIEDYSDEISEQKGELSELEVKAEELDARLDDIEDETDDEEIQEFIQLNRKQSELAGQISQITQGIERHETELETKRSEIAEQNLSTSRIEEIEDKIEDLRGKEERIEKEFIEKFNNQMETVLSELKYEGVERIWIERKRKRVKEGRKKVMKNVFDLHIVREIDGVATEDSIKNLSESEREVTSLILAITGYKVHDVQDVFPIAVVDSVEMVDAERLEQLLNYLSDYPDYLIVAALSEDVDAMDINEGKITEMPTTA